VSNSSSRFQKRLKTLRREHGWTQERAAEACGIGYKLFQLYELGIKNNPSLSSLDKIAHGFGLDVSELLSPNLPKLRGKKFSAKKFKAKQVA
jgi:transcriptional regulator with XRE-family HTH domain